MSVVHLRRRVRALETKAFGGDGLSHLTDEELDARCDELQAELERKGYVPDCGWDAPLPVLIKALEEDMEYA